MWCYGCDVTVKGVVEDIGNNIPDLDEEVFVIVPCTRGVF
jgi:hypothetical protein